MYMTNFKYYNNTESAMHSTGRPPIPTLLAAAVLINSPSYQPMHSWYYWKRCPHLMWKKVLEPILLISLLKKRMYGTMRVISINPQ